jgi:signal transduction histidine kinase
MSAFRFSGWSSPSALLGYGVAIVSVTVALAVALLLDTLLQSMPYVSLLLCSIMFVAWFGGLGPSLLAAALAAFYFTCFLVDHPVGSVAVATKDVPRVALFVITSLFVVSLSAAQRRNAESLRTARDDLARVNKALVAENAERKRVETYLDEAQALSHTASFGWKVVGEQVFLSKEGYRVLEVEPHEKLSIDLLRRRIHPDDRHILQNEIDRAVKGEREQDYEFRWLTPSGMIKHLHVRAHRMEFDPGEEEYVGAVMDVTDARKAQEALDAAQAALAHAARVATLGEMSASIAHEVNQPLAGIVTNGEAGLRWLDRREPDLGEVRSAMERMIRDAKRASQVVERLRALVRKTPARRLAIDLTDVITESVALLQREVQIRRIVLRTELARGLPPVLADRIELQQVVINLMVNGMQAMESVTDRRRLLLVQSSVDGNEVLITVQDSGIGIDAGAASRLFSPFFTTRDGGMGMGLSICRSIIESHGGRIWASPNEGPGATFRFALPLQEEAVR